MRNRGLPSRLVSGPTCPAVSDGAAGLVRRAPERDRAMRRDHADAARLNLPQISTDQSRAVGGGGVKRERRDLVSLPLFTIANIASISCKY